MVLKGWETVKLGEVAEIRGNRNINNLENIAFIPMELVPDTRIFVDYQIREKAEVKSFTYCEAGDLLLAKITPSLENGKQGIVPIDIPNGLALATTEVFPICCKGIDTFFLFYILKLPKFRNRVIASMTGTTGRQRASKDSITRLKIPLPSGEEQHKIARILSTVDEGIEKVDEAIEKTQRLKKGLMQELLTKGIGHKEFKDSEIGRIPKEWEVVKLRNVGRIATGKTPLTSHEKYWNGNIPFITPGDLQDSKYVYGAGRHVTTEGAQKVGILPRDTVLVVCIGSTIGKTGMVYRNSISNQQINSIICNSDIKPHYIYYSITFKSELLKSYSGVAAVPIIKKSLFENLKVSLPSLIEQQKIAEILSAVDKRLELEKKRKEILERIKRGLMEDLLTGKKRVTLNP